jgi:hypothetical protein
VDEFLTVELAFFACYRWSTRDVCSWTLLNAGTPPFWSWINWKVTPIMLFKNFWYLLID